MKTILLVLFVLSCGVVEPVAPQKQMIEELPAISLVNLAYRIEGKETPTGTRVTVYLYSHSAQRVTVKFYDVSPNAWRLLESRMLRAPGEVVVNLPRVKWAMRVEERSDAE